MRDTHAPFGIAYSHSSKLQIVSAATDDRGGATHNGDRDAEARLSQLAVLGHRHGVLRHA